MGGRLIYGRHRGSGKGRQNSEDREREREMISYVEGLQKFVYWNLVSNTLDNTISK
jgi:hypothetical protein